MNLKYLHGHSLVNYMGIPLVTYSVIPLLLTLSYPFVTYIVIPICYLQGHHSLVTYMVIPHCYLHCHSPFLPTWPFSSYLHGHSPCCAFHITVLQYIHSHITV